MRRSQVLLGYSHSSAGENKAYSVECMINVALQAPMMRTQDQTVPNKISTFWDSENQMKRKLSVTNLSSENNLPTFWLNAPVIIRAKVHHSSRNHFLPDNLRTSLTLALMTTGAFNRNVGKLFSELKLVTDNLSLYLCSSQLRSHWKWESATHKT